MNNKTINNAIEKTDLSYLRPLKQQHVKKMLKRFLEADSIKASTYSDAVILPGQNKLGGVLDKNGKFINESKNCWFGGYYDPPEELIVNDSRRVVYIGPYYGHTWGHIFTNIIPKLWYFLENDVEVDAYIIVAMEPDQKCNSVALNELLRLAGLADKIEMIRQPTRFQEVVVPEDSFDGFSYHPYFMKVVNEIKNNALLEEEDIEISSPKIFLSRSHFKKAINFEGGLELLDNYFYKNGFTIVHPEELSTVQAIKLMNKADIIACESGSVSFNALFSKESSKLLIIERIACYPRGNMIVNLTPSHRITYVDGSYSIYPVRVGECCILAYTDQFKQFSIDNNYLCPDDCYLSEEYFKQTLKVYFDCFNRIHNSGMVVPGYMKARISLYLEAFEDANAKYPWLNEYDLLDYELLKRIFDEA